MSKYSWTFWIIPLAIWGFYSCWHFGYQSGYADGHETAWQMFQPNMPATQVATAPAFEEPSDPEDPQ